MHVASFASRSLANSSASVVGRVVRVEPARVRQHPDPGGTDHRLLRPDPGLRRAEGGAVRRDADHREPPGLQGQHLLAQYDAPVDHLGGRQLVGSRGGPRRDVGDAQSEVEELVLLVGAELPGREAGPVQSRPEPVARAGEVVTGPGRHQAGVDPAEQHPQARRDHVGQQPVAGGLQLLAGRHRQRSSGSSATATNSSERYMFDQWKSRIGFSATTSSVSAARRSSRWDSTRNAAPSRTAAVG